MRQVLLLLFLQIKKIGIGKLNNLPRSHLNPRNLAPESALTTAQHYLLKTEISIDSVHIMVAFCVHVRFIIKRCFGHSIKAFQEKIIPINRSAPKPRRHETNGNQKTRRECAVMAKDAGKHSSP